MPCKHAELMMIYAKQEAEMDEPWKLWECKDEAGTPVCLAGHPSWNSRYSYRQIPKTININGHEVPEPMREKPEIGTKYWYVDIDELYQWTTWQDDEYDNLLLSRGLCHATEEAAIAHAKALFSFTEIKE